MNHLNKIDSSLLINDIPLEVMKLLNLLIKKGKYRQTSTANMPSSLLFAGAVRIEHLHVFGFYAKSALSGISNPLPLR